MRTDLAVIFIIHVLVLQLSDKEAGMLEERIKRSSRNRPQSATTRQPEQVSNNTNEEKPNKPPPQIKKMYVIVFVCVCVCAYCSVSK